MSLLRDAERWFHHRVLRHPRYTYWTADWRRLRTVCWCGLEWRQR